MATPAEIQPGVRVHGLDADRDVVIVSVETVGPGMYEVCHRDEFGRETTDLLFDSDLESLVVRRHKAAFRADCGTFDLAYQAVLLQHADLISPFLAVHTSNTEPLPHQIQAVYDHMLPRRPMRFLLADDPGAGKTIMAGLYVKQVLARGDVRRVLIVVPGGLVDQWREELMLRFGMDFHVYDRTVDSYSVEGSDAFTEHPLMLARLDQLARDPRLRERVAAVGWGLVVFDEAHKLSARYWGRELKATRRFELGRALSGTADNLLLMTATPHNGREEDFQLFLSLLEPDPVEPPPRAGARSPDSDMRRLLKEQLLTDSAERLFPDRVATTVTYRLTPLEQTLYERVTEYVREEMQKATADDTRRGVGFALLVLQRRLASSPEAIMQSLTRRRDRLAEEALAVRAHDASLEGFLADSIRLAEAEEDADEVTARDREVLEERGASAASAARTAAELEAEVAILDELVLLAREVRDADVDRKWQALAKLLTSPDLIAEDGSRRKIIVFTEHRATLDYLGERINELLPGAQAWVEIHGGTPRQHRREAVDSFWNDETTSVLLATDAAGEGVNLQCAHLMVNYDLPWNPNRLEQRFGRIHRIGQRETCHLWNLVAADTREGDVFRTLLDKLDVQREALGDQVFDVLGDVLKGGDLSSLLTRALSADESTARIGREVDEFADRVIGDDLEEAVKRRRLLVGELTRDEVAALASRLRASESLNLQPQVGDFVVQALGHLHGDIRPTYGGRHRISRVPEAVRHSPERTGTVRRRYEAVTFDKDSVDVPGLGSAALLTPGHPLVAALAEHVLERHGAELQEGIVCRDPEAPSASLYVLLRHDLVLNGSVLSQRSAAIRVAGDGTVHEVPSTLPLDLAAVPASVAGSELVDEVIPDVEIGLTWCATELAPTHRAEFLGSLSGQGDGTHQPEQWQDECHVLAVAVLLPG